MASQGLVERHADGAGGGAGGEPADVTARRRGEARWVGVLVLETLRSDNEKRPTKTNDEFDVILLLFAHSLYPGYI